MCVIHKVLLHSEMSDTPELDQVATFFWTEFSLDHQVEQRKEEFQCRRTSLFCDWRLSQDLNILGSRIVPLPNIVAKFRGNINFIT
jgi:hypothetical protein